MSIPGSAAPFLLASEAAPAAYEIERSLRFNSADSAYLSRTPASAGNRKTWTWAGWVKRSTLSVRQTVFDGGGTSSGLVFEFSAADKLELYTWGGVSPGISVACTPVFRDIAAWFHLLVAFDTTQAVAANRYKLYVNGQQINSFDTTGYPTQNVDYPLNSAAIHSIGRRSSSSFYLGGYLADVHLIDGQALTPTSFGEFDTNNVWQPKKYSGPTPTGNSFWLPFSDNSAATATALGKDGFLLGNNWTPNNLSVTAGAGNDSLTDSPTNYGTDTGTGGSVRGNYCTLNPLDCSSSITLSNGSLDAINPSQGAWYMARSTFGMSTGKWYWEVLINNTSGGTVAIGMANRNSSLDGYVGQTTGGHGWLYNGSLAGAGASGSATSLSNGDVLGFAFNADAGTLALYLNGSVRSGSFSGLTSGPYFPAVSLYTPGSVSLNAGQRPFAYTAPSGFKALCTQSLPTPTITNGATAMDVKLYTGTGASQTISGLGFSPDFIWTKARSVANSHFLYDVLRVNAGSTPANKPYYLRTDTTAAESASVGITSFDSNGFTLDGNSSTSTLNATYAAWCWDAGSSTVTNTSGTISSQVRASASAGFSVVTYTFNSTGTVGHGLGVAPEFIIVKTRNSAAQWFVYHKSLGINQYIRLSFTGPAVSFAGAWDPVNSTTFKMEAGLHTLSDYVAYCWAPVAGYSAFGSYTGSSDGPFVYTGFRPKWVMIKSSSATADWTLVDASRPGYNVTSQGFNPNLSDAESGFYAKDLLSNGFKIQNSTQAENTAGATYIWAAFAEHPFALARAR